MDFAFELVDFKAGRINVVSVHAIFDEWIEGP